MSTPALMEKGGSLGSAVAGSGSSSDRRYAGETVTLEELRIDSSSGTEKKVCPLSVCLLFDDDDEPQFNTPTINNSNDPNTNTRRETLVVMVVNEIVHFDVYLEE